MALEAGGYSEKLGNRYEANWIAYQLLQLLDEKILSLIVEPVGDDEVGVDVVVEQFDGKREFHQCKASNANNEFWSLAQMNQAKILTNALFQIKRGVHEFHLVSPLTSKRFSDICDSALNSNEDANDFIKHQINPSPERLKDIKALANYLGLSIVNDKDLNQILLFLKSFKVISYSINSHTTNYLKDKANTLFAGNPTKLLSFLKSYVVEYNRLRIRITSKILFNDLNEAGFETRVRPDDSRVASVIERIALDFSNSIKPYLISKTLIERPETLEIYNSLESHAVTLVKAEAGMGKSAVLLALHEKMMLENAISIPIRLDRNRPENNADSFGEKLGFQCSPVLALSMFAKQQKSVLILDQLDAIRWTASHSNNALQVCQELVRQVINLRKSGMDISIVLACRNFDLDEDVALSSWITGLDDEVTEVSVSRLNQESVLRLIAPFEQYELLSEEKKKVLSIPLWLSIYLTIATREQLAPQFSNKLELVQRFWEDRYKELSSLKIDVGSAKQLIDEVVDLMNSKSRLSVSENILTPSSIEILDALISVGVLSKQSRQISFRHQALFDFQIGLKLFSSALSSPEKFINEIGDFSQQTLTRREHLKYALNMLLDYDQKEFSNSILILLLSNKIRFHLKYLAFNSLRDLVVLKASEKLLIDKIVSDSTLLSNFISISCFNNHLIVSYLSDGGHITAWLGSDDDVLINITSRLLSSVADHIPDKVIKEMSPYLNKSKEWSRRVYDGLCWSMENDSDAMFEIRKSLINNGCHGRSIQWKAIVKKSPFRALDLIEMLLLHYKNFLCVPWYSVKSKLEKLGHRDTWSNSELEGINNLALSIPKETLTRLLSIVDDISGEHGDSNTSYYWLSKDKYSNYDAVKSITNGVFSIIDNCGKELGATPNLLLEIIRPYLSNINPIINHLIGKQLLNLSTDKSDIVIEWLLNSPESRFCCGNKHLEPEWILPSLLIEKFSSFCSVSLYERLEHSIYYFSKFDIERVKWRLEERKRGVYYCFWGETQHVLLSKLPTSKTTINTKQLITVLNRKFKSYAKSDFCSVSSHSGGMVRSPLPVPNVLSNGSWSKLILSPKEKMIRGNWIQQSKDVVEEASIEQFSSSLSEAVSNQPIRFANLALTLPPTIDKQYINAIYNGLTEINVLRVNEAYRDDWDLCPPSLVEKVINHFDNKDSTSSLVRLVEKRITENGWSKYGIELLIKLAINSKDPEPNKLNVRNTNESEFANDACPDTLRTNAINCDRGTAYRGISRVFLENESLAMELRYLIQIAIDDPHPAVNIVALDMLLPTFKYDEKFSHKTFLELCNKDLRMTLGHGTYYFFNSGFEGENQAAYIKLVIKMLSSSFDDIRKEAGKQVCARWFFYDLFENEILQVMQGDDQQLEGVASVVTQFLSEDKYQEHFYKLPSIFEQLVNVENQDILRMVGGCVNNENFWNIIISKQIFSSLVTSKAAIYCMYDLFEAIDKHTGSLLDYQEQLLQLVVNITNSSEQHIDIEESTLLEVLLRLYDEATEDDDVKAINICLDIWDKLLSSDLYSTINASKKLENGLLS